MAIRKRLFCILITTQNIQNHSDIFSTYGRHGDGYNDINKLKRGVSSSCYDGNTTFCARLLEINGWKVPDDYPYKF